MQAKLVDFIILFFSADADKSDYQSHINIFREIITF